MASGSGADYSLSSAQKEQPSALRLRSKSSPSEVVPKTILTASPWKEALKACADPQRAREFVLQLAAKAGHELSRFDAETARVIVSLFSGSLAVSEWLIQHPEWLDTLNPESLRNPRREQGLRREVSEWLEPALASGNHSEALSKLRLFHRRESMRLAARDLARIPGTSELTLELSNLADVCLNTVWRVCYEQHATRLGKPYHQDP